MKAYVVEDLANGNITDVVSFKLQQGMDGNKLFAYITILISTTTSVKQLLTDVLVCVKQEKVEEPEEDGEMRLF